jgi:hypothetical protein
MAAPPPTTVEVKPVKVTLVLLGRGATASWRMTCSAPECVSSAFFLSSEKAGKRMASAHRRGHHFTGQVVELATPPGSIDWGIEPPSAPRRKAVVEAPEWTL